MDVKQQFSICKVYTLNRYEGYKDVIKIVEWQCDFTDGVSSCTVHGETILDLSRLKTSFTEAAKVSHEKLERWIKAEMGSQWDFMVEEHIQVIQKMTDKASLTVYYEA